MSTMPRPPTTGAPYIQGVQAENDRRTESARTDEPRR